MTSLHWLDVFFNLAMGALAVWLWTRLRRRPTFWRTVLFGGELALAGTTGALVIGGEPFGVARMLAWTVFLHGPLWSAGAAAILWRPARRTAVLCAIVSLALAAVAVDAFWIEPTRLQVTRLRFESPAISEPVRIVVLADFQTDVFGPYERSVLEQVMAEQPDLILAAGDYVQADGETAERVRGAASAAMRELGFHARRGVFAVRGNIDDDRWPEFFDGMNVQAVEQTHTFDLGAGVRLTCLSESDSFTRGLRIPRPVAAAMHIVLGHSPDYALGQIDADLLVAGHTHGGQVQVPWIGPLANNSRLPRAMSTGVTRLPDGAHLVIPRGTGMERGRAPRLRFLCRPELVVIELVPKA